MAVGLTFGAPAASAAPWSCDGFGYLFQAPAGTPLVYQVDLATGQYTSLPGGTTDLVNAVGYNSLDNFAYAWSNPLGSVVRIHDDGTLEPLPLPVGVVIPGSTGTSYNVGDVDANGHYWMLNNTVNPDLWYEIDLVPGSPTYGQVLSQGTIPVFPSTLAGPVGSDWAWVNGALYSVVPGSAGGSHLVSFTAAGGVVDRGALPVPSSAVNFGAVYVDAAGYLYASENASGSIYRINPVTGQTILASDGPPSGFNDGARCANAPIPTVTVTKTVDGRVRPADQFTAGLVRPDGTAATSATTSGTATTASTVDFPASQGQTYTITDAMATGSPTPLGEYAKSITCTDGAGNPVATGGNGPTWTLAIGAAAHYTCNVTNRAEADTVVQKTMTPSPFVPGKQATYHLKVTNNGPSTATNVKVSDPLPNGVTYVSGDSGCSETSGTVTCTLNELAVGQSKTFDITVKMASSLDRCPSNTASVSSSIFDPDMSNNIDQICPTPGRQVDLSITKTESQKLVTAGGQAMYTLVVKNHGPSDASQVKVVDPMAQGLTLQSANPSQGSCSTAKNRVSCSLGNLPVGGSAQILVTTNVWTTPGDIRNVATVSGAEKETNPDNNQDDALITVEPGPDQSFDLVVKKTANHKRISAGGTVRYTITVTNNGPDTAPNATVKDTFNRRASVKSVSSTAGTCTKALPISCSLGDIPAGGKVTITVVVQPLVADCHERNTASATGAGKDTNPKNNLSKVDICVSPKLKVVKTVDRKSVVAGGLVHYTIRTTNVSKKVTARNVRTCDRLPSGLVFVNSKPKAKLSKGSYCWKAKQLRAGKSVTYRLTVRALGGADGRKRNVATAAGPDGRRHRDPALVEVLGRQGRPTAVTG